MGLAGTITRRSLRQHPGRTLFSILGVAVGIATVVATFTLDHVTLLSRTWVDPNWRADLEVRATEEEMSWLRGPLRTVERTGLDPLVEESQIPGAELDEAYIGYAQPFPDWEEGKETFLTEDEDSDYEEESSEEDEEDEEDDEEDEEDDE